MKPLTKAEQGRARDLLAPGGVLLSSVASLQVTADGAELQLRTNAGARTVTVSPDAIRELLAAPPATVQPLLFDLDSTGVIHGPA